MHACSGFVASGAFLIVVASAAGGEPQITPLVLENDVIPGVGIVTTIHNFAVNDLGSWLVEADTDGDPDFDSVLIRDGAVDLREGDPLPAPPGSSIEGFDSILLNDAGDSGWNFFLRGTGGSGDDSGIYFNTTLVIQESDLSTAPQFSAGTPYLGFFETKFNDANQILIMASVDDPGIPSSVDRALVIAAVDGAGNLLDETVIWKEGDILPGQTAPIEDFETGPHDFAFDSGGSVMFIAELAAPAAVDMAIYIDGILIAQEGSPSVVAGRDYEFLTRTLDLNDGARYVFRANLAGDTADDELIVHNESVLAREGGTLPAISPFTFTGFGNSSTPVRISNAERVLWYGEWNDPDPDTNSGLFVNDELIVQEGVTQVNGIVIDTIAAVQDAFTMSREGRWVIFEATLADGREGAFLIDLAVPEVVLPSTFNVIFGALQSGNVTALHESDDIYVEVEQRPAFTPLLPLIRVDVSGGSPFESASALAVTLEARSNAIPVRPPQRLSLFNYGTSAFEIVDERIATLTDSVVEVTITDDPGRFIEAHTRNLKMRVEYFNPGNVFSPAWGAFLDQAIWEITPTR